MSWVLWLILIVVCIWVYAAHAKRAGGNSISSTWAIIRWVCFRDWSTIEQAGASWMFVSAIILVPAYTVVCALYVDGGESGESWAGYFLLADMFMELPALFLILIFLGGFGQERLTPVFYGIRLGIAGLRFTLRSLQTFHCVRDNLEDLVIGNELLQFTSSSTECSAISLLMTGSLFLAFMVAVTDFQLTETYLAKVDYMETRFRQIVFRFGVFNISLSMILYLIIYGFFYLSFQAAKSGGWFFPTNWPGALLMLRPNLLVSAFIPMAIAFLPPGSERILCFELQERNPYSVPWGDVYAALCASDDAYYDPPTEHKLSKSADGYITWKRGGYRVLGMVRDEENDAHCLIAEVTPAANASTEWSLREGDLIIAFRGTASWQNVLTDLNFVRKPLPFDFLVPRYVLKKKKTLEYSRPSLVRHHSLQIRNKESPKSKKNTKNQLARSWTDHRIFRGEHWKGDAKKRLSSPRTWKHDGNNLKDDEKEGKRSVYIDQEIGIEMETKMKAAISIEMETKVKATNSIELESKTKETLEVPPNPLAQITENKSEDAVNEQEEKEKMDEKDTGWARAPRKRTQTPLRGKTTAEKLLNKGMQWLLPEKAHKGFLNHYLSLRDKLLQRLDPLLAPQAAKDIKKQRDRRNSLQQPDNILPRSGSLRRPKYFHAPSLNAVDEEEAKEEQKMETESKIPSPKAVRRTKKILITGHSLGGALATLAAFDLKNRYTGEYDVRMINLASPRVGDYRFSEVFNVLVPHALRVVYSRDIVPGIPKFFCLFKHIGHEVTIDGSGSILVDPSPIEKAFIRNGATSAVVHKMTSYAKGVAACLRSRVSSSGVECLDRLCQPIEHKESKILAETRRDW
eukprot:CAMPEP_0167748258 /NCGR_PEP_ID=MMETSP0110_2-20121227/4742_1 /TAXON_ID=629695 /ORGANISM="Gymnochlora sp., Strain CCMP2014" /LENGTH=854 /DNA_ID=CAMNT_0007633261 /DNA_START=108 /DNA_END=2669 /DNA_ORIENTATION=+